VVGFFAASGLLMEGGFLPTEAGWVSFVVALFMDTMLTLITERAGGLSERRLGVTTKSNQKDHVADQGEGHWDKTAASDHRPSGPG
jgi:hypothetical protein